MSGWNPADRWMDENAYTANPAVNTITVYGQLPSDQVPSPSTLLCVVITCV